MEVSRMNDITKEILKDVSDYSGDDYQYAYNIREDGCCVGRQSTDNIKIENKPDAPGLVIRVLPGTKGERVSIPACVTHGNVDDVVYNDFYIGEGADVLIIAGCGVHVSTGEPAAITVFTAFSWRRTPMSYMKKNMWEKVMVPASALSTR